MVVTLVLQTRHGDSHCRACMSAFYCHVRKSVGLLGAEAVSLNPVMTDSKKHSPSILNPSPVMSKKSSSQIIILQTSTWTHIARFLSTFGLHLERVFLPRSSFSDPSTPVSAWASLWRQFYWLLWHPVCSSEW